MQRGHRSATSVRASSRLRGTAQVCGRVTTARYSRRTWRLMRGESGSAKPQWPDTLYLVPPGHAAWADALVPGPRPSRRPTQPPAPCTGPHRATPGRSIACMPLGAYFPPNSPPSSFVMKTPGRSIQRETV